MHRTLNSVIAKFTEAKGNWVQVVPMALYFLRCRSFGLSPFALKHGWEPTIPLHLLYKGWVQQELGPIDLEQWVAENVERIQRMRDEAVANMSATCYGIVCMTLYFLISSPFMIAHYLESNSYDYARIQNFCTRYL